MMHGPACRGCTISSAPKPHSALSAGASPTGCLTPEEVGLRSFARMATRAVRLSSAAYAFYDPTANAGGMGRPARRQGPVWFRKMDRNTDGDVSRGEFLGDESDFAMLDANGDGLIALEEADAYEQKVRPAKPGAMSPRPWRNAAACTGPLTAP